MKKRFFLAPLAGLVVAGAVSGFAATLNVTDGGLGAGSVAVGSCDSDVALSYGTVWNGTAVRHDVSSVTVSGIAAGCKSISVQIGSQSFSDSDLSNNAGSFTADITDESASGFVGPVHVVVSG